MYCASQSQARHELLAHAQIPFVVIKTSVIEEDEVVTGTVQEQVAALAAFKHSGISVAECAVQQSHSTGRLYFVTADTLIGGVNNRNVYGKPINRQHAIEMLQEISRQEIIIATGMCVSMWEFDTQQGAYTCITQDTWVAQARAEYVIPDAEIESYLDACPLAMKGCGAAVIDGVGISYFKSINGSYTGALGLDMFGLRQWLMKNGFYQ